MRILLENDGIEVYLAISFSENPLYNSMEKYCHNIPLKLLNIGLKVLNWFQMFFLSETEKYCQNKSLMFKIICLIVVLVLCTTFGGMWRWRRVAVARVFALVVRCRIMRLIVYSRVGKNRDTRRESPAAAGAARTASHKPSSLARKFSRHGCQ